MRRRHYAYESRTDANGYTRFYSVWTARTPMMRYIVDVNKQTRDVLILVARGYKHSNQVHQTTFPASEVATTKTIEKFIDDLCRDLGPDVTDQWMFPPTR